MWISQFQIAFAQMYPSSSQDFFDQVDQSDIKSILYNLRNIGVYPDHRYILEQIDESEFIPLFGLSKQIINRLPANRRALIVNSAFDKLVDGNLSVFDNYSRAILNALEDYIFINFTETNKEINDTYGSISEKEVFEQYKSVFWAGWDGIFKEQLPLEEATSYSAVENYLSTDQNTLGHLNNELRELMDSGYTSIFTWVSQAPEEYAKGRQIYLRNSGITLDIDPPLFSNNEMEFKLVSSNMSDLAESLREQERQFEFEVEWISAEGLITPETPEKFNEFLHKICADNNRCDLQEEGVQTITLHSKGGSLAAGIDLGILIREKGFSTAVSSTVKNNNETNYYSTAPGRCFSACAYAFLGGLTRRLDFSSFDPSYEGERLGLHRFYEGGSMSKRLNELENLPVFEAINECRISDPVARTQCVDSELIGYILKMGGEPAYFQIAATTDREEIRILTTRELLDLNVLTQGFYLEWVLGSWGTGISAKTMKNDPGGLVSNISAYCINVDQNFLELNLDESIQASDYTDNGWVIAANEHVFTIQTEDVRSHENRLALLIQKEDWQRILLSDQVELQAQPIQINTAQSRPKLNVNALLNKKALKRIHWALKNCT